MQEETLQMIKECNDYELLVWKEQIEEDRAYYGENHQAATYEEIKKEIANREQMKKEFNVRQEVIGQKAESIIATLQSDGYSLDDLKEFAKIFQTKVNNFEKELEKGHKR